MRLILHHIAPERMEVIIKTAIITIHTESIQCTQTEDRQRYFPADVVCTQVIQLCITDKWQSELEFVTRCAVILVSNHYYFLTISVAGRGTCR